MIFLDIDHYIAVFWSGDEEFLDRRIEILHSQNRYSISKLIINRNVVARTLIVYYETTVHYLVMGSDNYRFLYDFFYR